MLPNYNLNPLLFFSIWVGRKDCYGFSHCFLKQLEINFSIDISILPAKKYVFSIILHLLSVLPMIKQFMGEEQALHLWIHRVAVYCCRKYVSNFYHLMPSKSFIRFHVSLAN